MGLVPGIVHPYIGRRIGSAAVRRLALGGPSLDAWTAERLGLVDEVTDSPDAALDRLSAAIGRLGPDAVARYRALSAELPAGWASRATDAFHAAWTGPEAQTRMARWRDGLAPWLDDPWTS
ncbi:MAG: hypothetical protein R3F61_30380 [Myxococcota bacterium]